MNKIGILVISVLLGIQAFGQSREMMEGDSIPWELRKQSFIYNSGVLFNDPTIARMALYNLLAENPANLALYDSLALSYFQYQRYASAALVSQQALKIKGDNPFALEIAATSMDQLGAKDRSLNYYEKLHLLNADINTLYKIAFLQFELDRYEESKTSVGIIMNDRSADAITIRFAKQDNTYQDVPLKAAASRILALIAEDKGEIEEAKKLYLSTLELAPGFELVQFQLRELTKPKAAE